MINPNDKNDGNENKREQNEKEIQRTTRTLARYRSGEKPLWQKTGNDYRD